MIRSFVHKGLAEFFASGRTRGIRADLQDRIRDRLNILHRAVSLTDLRVPGLDFHALHGKPQRYSLKVNGPGGSPSNGWRATLGVWTWSSTIEGERHA
jgi:toxin HigB-1